MKKAGELGTRPKQTLGAGENGPTKKVNGPEPERSKASQGVLEQSLGNAIRRAQVYAYQEFSTFMRPLGIRPAQYALLVLLHRNPGLMQSAAGEALNIEKANLTGLLLELRSFGLIERRSVPFDGRAYTLHLTERGKSKVRKLVSRHDEYEQSLASSLSAPERAQLLSLLHKLIDR